MTIELGVARGIDAQAFGQPGQRTFKLRVLGSSSESVSLWIEKEHLSALGMAIRQLLAQLKYEEEPRATDLGQFPKLVEQEFQISLMAIGFNPPERTLVIQVSELGVGEDDEPTLRVQLTLEHCASLAVQIDDIVARGRPVCPLCGLSINPSGHSCIRSNGHSEQPIPESRQEENPDD